MYNQISHFLSLAKPKSKKTSRCQTHNTIALKTPATSYKVVRW